MNTNGSNTVNSFHNHGLREMCHIRGKGLITNDCTCMNKHPDQYPPSRGMEPLRLGNVARVAPRSNSTSPSNGGTPLPSWFMGMSHDVTNRSYDVMWCHILPTSKQAKEAKEGLIWRFLLYGTGSRDQLTTVHLFVIFLQPHDVHTVGSCAPTTGF